MATITLNQWREEWPDYVDAPDDRDRERERTFLAGVIRVTARGYTWIRQRLLRPRLTARKPQRSATRSF